MINTMLNVLALPWQDSRKTSFATIILAVTPWTVAWIVEPMY